MSDYLVFRADQISGSNPVVPLHQVEEIAAERDRYLQAINECLNWANGRQSEWGDRAENAFAFLEKAIITPRDISETTPPRVGINQ